MAHPAPAPVHDRLSGRPAFLPTSPQALTAPLARLAAGGNARAGRWTKRMAPGAAGGETQVIVKPGRRSRFRFRRSNTSFSCHQIQPATSPRKRALAQITFAFSKIILRLDRGKLRIRIKMMSRTRVYPAQDLGLCCYLCPGNVLDEI